MTICYEYESNLYINITNKCTNNCTFCVRNNSEGSLYAKNLWLEREPSKEEVLEEIKTWNLNNYKQIVFCGYGEPTCRWDDMLWICAEIKKIGNYTIRLNTNGHALLVTGRNCVIEAKNLIDTFSVSLNASNSQSYQNICHSVFGEKSFDSMLEFTKESVKCIDKVYMTVVDTMDDEEINLCRAICKNLGAEFRVRTYISK